MLKRHGKGSHGNQEFRKPSSSLKYYGNYNTVTSLGKV